MITTTAPTAAKAVTDNIPEIPLGERVASDLRTLASLITAHPELADDLADAVRVLHVVMSQANPAGPAEHVKAGLAHDGTEVNPISLDHLWETRCYQLPAGAVRVNITQLCVPPVA